MTDTHVNPEPRPTPEPPRGSADLSPVKHDSTRWAKFLSAAQLILALALTAGVLGYLLLAPSRRPLAEDGSQVPTEVVQPAGPGLIRIQPGTPLEKKLQIVTVQTTSISSPILTVTGTVVASLRPGPEKGTDSWQFHSPEVLTAYTDWQRAIADISFSEKQLDLVRDLDAKRVADQEAVVEQMRRLVKNGTERANDLFKEETTLRQYRIQGQKEMHEAESALRIARRTEAALARQLQQAGVEPDLLRSATSDMDIVMADVPEVTLVIVKKGQSCEAKFFGVPDQTFSGKVTSIAPVLSKERRSLRALFVIHDPKDQLRPGMFAEIGLGTDPRDALLAPAEGVVHAGRNDYVLVAADEPGTWRVAEVQVGEPHNNQVEVRSGVINGDRVLGKGAILLKPAIVRALQAPANATKGSLVGGDR